MDNRFKLISQKRRELGLSQSQLGEMVGLSQQQIGRIENGSPITIENARKLSEVLGIDRTLLLPEGFLPAHLEGVSAIANKITSAFKKDEVTIEMIDATACCGDGIDNLPEKTCGYWRLPIAEFKSITSSSPENLRMLRVQGDSMKPTIDDGDWVWVDTSNNYIGSDGMYLIRMATGLAVKRLQSGLSNVVIKSDNPTYSDITADVGEVKIIGKVVYILNGRRV
jgi:SOS-response transcriptional repressor LexA